MVLLLTGGCLQRAGTCLFHRIIESKDDLGGRDLKDHLVPTPLPGAGTPSPSPG